MPLYIYIDYISMEGPTYKTLCIYNKLKKNLCKPLFFPVYPFTQELWTKCMTQHISNVCVKVGENRLRIVKMYVLVSIHTHTYCGLYTLDDIQFNHDYKINFQ